MENMIFCQSCGMPMRKDEEFGTEFNGSKNNDYCVYCYKDGKFTEDLTMDGMIEHCIKFLDEYKKDPSADKNMTAEDARKKLREWFPTLKRWKAA